MREAGGERVWVGEGVREGKEMGDIERNKSLGIS